MTPIYLDYNATTPVHPDVLQAMMPWLAEHFGNPSSGHPFGRRARAAVVDARTQVAGLLGAAPEEIIFTGGGTESNNLALLGTAEALVDKGRHIVTSVVEHPAVVEPLKVLAARGWRISRVPVDDTGRVHAQEVAKALEPDTVLVTVMHANNEVGTINDLGAMADLVRPRGILLHTDAAQSVGKVPTRVDELKVDLLTVAGHKLYAPKGVGALYVRRATPLVRVVHGANQERGLRPGTENVPYLVGLGAACALAQQELPERMARMKELRDRLEERLLEALGNDGVRSNGNPDARLPNTLSISFANTDASTLLGLLDGQVAASAGAACHSDEADSSVLGAMRVPPTFRNGTLRLSTGRLLTTEDVDRGAERIIAAVEALRQSPSTV